MYTPKNQSIFESFKKLIKSAANFFIERQVNANELFLDNKERCERKDDGIIRWSKTPRLNFDMVLSIYRDDILNLTEFKEAKVIVDDDIVLHSYYNKRFLLIPHIKIENSIDMVVLYLKGYYKLFGYLVYESTSFEQSMIEWDDLFYNKAVKYVSISPLVDFGMDSEELEVSSHLKISQLSTEYLQDVIKASPQLNYFNINDTSNNFGLVYDSSHIEPESVKKKRAMQYAETMSKIYSELHILSTAMRIFKRGNLQRGVVVTRPKNKFICRHNIVNTLSSDVDSKGFGEVYHLDGDEKEAFKGFYTDLIRKLGTEYDKYPIAISRYDIGYERERLEDKLIDILISLESIYLSHEGELSFKLSMRAAFRLGETGEERRKIYNYIKKAYDLRSKLVHGEIVKIPSPLDMRDKKIGSNDFVMKIEQYLRKSIKHIIDNEPTWFNEKKSKGDKFLNDVFFRSIDN